MADVDGQTEHLSGRHREVLLASPLLRGLTPGQLASMAALWEEHVYQPGQAILREGERDNFVHLLLDGRAEVIKTSSVGTRPSRIGELGAGDTFGEVKVVDRQPSSASVVAVTPVTVVSIDLDVFDRHAVLAEARAIVWRNVGQILAERLRRTSLTGADAIQRELTESEARAYAGRFVLLVFAMIAIFELGLSAVAMVPAGRRPPNVILSFAFAFWTATPVALLLLRTPFSLDSYGLNFSRGWAQAWRGFLWTTPLLALLLLLKLVAVHTLPSMEGRPFFDPTVMLAGRPFDARFFAFAMLLYGLHAPLQEFARAGLQGSLQHFLRVPRGTVDWRAIVISNLLFASSHGFLGFWFSVAAFLPGVFWGWLFARQSSLIGLAVSHIAVGWLAFFALGLHGVIRGG